MTIDLKALKEAAENERHLARVQYGTSLHAAAERHLQMLANPATILSLIAELEGARKEAKRYEVLRIRGAAVMSSPAFAKGLVSRFTNLDALADYLIEHGTGAMFPATIAALTKPEEA